MLRYRLVPATLGAAAPRVALLPGWVELKRDPKRAKSASSGGQGGSPALAAGRQFGLRGCHEIGCPCARPLAHNTRIDVWRPASQRRRRA